MHLKVDVPVTVAATYNSQSSKFIPTNLRWDGREYAISKIGLHHHFRNGRTLFHIFSVTSSDTFFRLSFNTDNLSWRLEEVSDGLPE